MQSLSLVRAMRSNHSHLVGHLKSDQLVIRNYHNCLAVMLSEQQLSNQDKGICAFVFSIYYPS